MMLAPESIGKTQLGLRDPQATAGTERIHDLLQRSD
jgi:hypothetical protein